MDFDPERTHPLYDAFRPAWTLMRASADGEDTVKEAGRDYLPETTSMMVMPDQLKRHHAYSAYAARAEFPEIVAPTVRGAVGMIHEQPAQIELPPALEPLRERSTIDGLSLDAFHQRITTELMTMGRYGVLPAIAPDGMLRLAGYTAESIISWGTTDGTLDFVMLDETGPERDPESNAWNTIKTFRELRLEDGRFVWRVWRGEGLLVPEADFSAARPGGRNQHLGLIEVPLVIGNTLDLTPDPDDIPLYGLAKIAVRLYQLDADYRQALHMTAQPTPYVTGFDDPMTAIEEGLVPNRMGTGAGWVLPPGATAGYLEFSGSGIGAILAAKTEAREAAVMFGAQMFADTRKTAESGDARRLRLAGQTATFKQVAIQSAATLERALRYGAVMVGADPDAVSVAPPLNFLDVELNPQEVAALIKGWVDGAYSWATLFEKLRSGRIIPADRSEEEEQKLMDEEATRGPEGFADVLPVPQAAPPPGTDVRDEAAETVVPGNA